MELKRHISWRVRDRRSVLIEPLWNWNRTKDPSGAHVWCVLIEPLWNWNTFRTTESRVTTCLNRTFMELKLVKDVRLARKQKCLNRTFMELKPSIKNLRDGIANVLIEPLWNWNASTHTTAVFASLLLSIIYILNGRKVIAWILWRVRNGKI